MLSVPSVIEFARIIEEIKMKKVLVAFYSVDGLPDRVTLETPIVGTPKEQYADLESQMQRKFPKKKFRREGSVVESRTSDDPGHITTSEGQTLRRLFPDVPKDAREDTLQVGTVHFDGEPTTIWLLYNRERNSVSPILKPRLSGRPIRPGLSFSGGHLVSELHSLLTKGLGSQARNLVLKIK